MTEHSKTLLLEDNNHLQRNENLSNIKFFVEILENCKVGDDNISLLWNRIQKQIAEEDDLN